MVIRLHGHDSASASVLIFTSLEKAIQNLVDTVAADIVPTSLRVRTFDFTQAFSVANTIAAAPDFRCALTFVELAQMLFAMFDIPLWGLIVATTCTCMLILLGARVGSQLCFFQKALFITDHNQWCVLCQCQHSDDEQRPLESKNTVLSFRSRCYPSFEHVSGGTISLWTFNARLRACFCRRCCSTTNQLFLTRWREL